MWLEAGIWCLALIVLMLFGRWWFYLVEGILESHRSGIPLMRPIGKKIPGNELLKQAVNLPWNRRCGKCISKNTGATLLAIPMTV